MPLGDANPTWLNSFGDSPTARDVRRQPSTEGTDGGRSRGLDRSSSWQSREGHMNWPFESGHKPMRRKDQLVNVLIVDDHGIVRNGVRLYLELDGAINVVGEAENGEIGVRLARELRPDVVLMDVSMPGMDGFAATAAIHQQVPNVEVVILTTHLEASVVVRAVRAGAIGCLDKSIGPKELCKAVRAAANGEAQLPPEATVALVREMRLEESAENLSARETEIVSLLVRGLSNKEIANALHIGEKTVKTHMTNIMQKLGVQSRTQAALRALKLGIVQSDSDARAV
jgi:DNA-binding NarL/FixJ family response regulator